MTKDSKEKTAPSGRTISTSLWLPASDTETCTTRGSKARAQANSEASLGKYVPGSQPSIEESLFVKNYAY